MSKNPNSDDKARVRCPRCGYSVSHAELGRIPPISLLPMKDILPVRRIRPLSPKEQIESLGDVAFISEAVKRGWSVFSPETPDCGQDYVIAKDHAVVMVQLKTGTQMGDDRYHVTISRILEGPLGFAVYHFQNIDKFFLIPSTEYWRIPRFAQRRDTVFKTKPYSDTMSYETAKREMGEYEGDKGWEILEHLTTIEGLLKAIRHFQQAS